MTQIYPRPIKITHPKIHKKIMFIDKHAAAKVTGLSAETLKKARLSGKLIEGIHYVKLNCRTVRYNFELLQDWMQNRHDRLAHQRAIEIYQSSLLSSRRKGKI